MVSDGVASVSQGRFSTPAFAFPYNARIEPYDPQGLEGHSQISRLWGAHDRFFLGSCEEVKTVMG
jgi:hypothetical protein